MSKVADELAASVGVTLTAFALHKEFDECLLM
jgi:hypothetical protein